MSKRRENTGRPPVETGLFHAPTEEDLALARRRFAAYNRISAKYPDMPFKDILRKLPRDGGTALPCGCTRFDHLTDGACPKGVLLDPYGDLR